MTKPDPITEADLLSYVDEEVDMARRVEIEDHLSRHPDAAARVMADLRTRDMLRLAFPRSPTRHSARTLDAAYRLKGGLVVMRIAHQARRAAAMAALVALGWFAHAQVGLLGVSQSEASPTPPPFVKEALDAHRTALLRVRMRSQIETPDYDPDEIHAATQIRLPRLPEQWRVADVQIFPSRDGYSVEMTIDAGSALGRLSLFSGLSASFAVIEPTVARSGTGTTVYWQIGSLAYALTGTAPEPALERAATRLSKTLR